MNRPVVARLLRGTLPAAAILGLPAGAAALDASVPVVLTLVAVVTATLVRFRPALDTLVERITGHREITPYSALAAAAQRLRSPSLDEALPGLARVLAEGTGARRAAVWLAVGPRLEMTAAHPDPGTDRADNLAVLLARPSIGHVVPVLDGTELRAALTIEKPELPVTSGDRVLMQDVANGAALLLRTVALNAELTERVRRADRLAAELRASQQRLARARAVERRRLLTELSRATSGRLVALRLHMAAVRAGLSGAGPSGAGVGDAEAGAALVRARTEVDELLDRFRVIARGVYPAVLRSQGPGAALEELAADLRRVVRLTGDLGFRVAWEIESAAYQVVAAALGVLADRAGGTEIEVRLTRSEGRVRVWIEDPEPPVSAERIRTLLVDDIERLVALGGDVRCVEGEGAELRLLAWLPDRLDVLLDADPPFDPSPDPPSDPFPDPPSDRFPNPLPNPLPGSLPVEAPG